ncbi:acyl carrier protein [Streptomyces sp. NRRL F-3307]|uniref:acyl carrier protein n=1 Tax=Streptomyces sp. NRRL F-3307 TaxID=1463849 RepID=UPI0004C877E7|nr:acyl carrier protein [Streptomyces sp. NRRL F-3307]
MDQALLDWFRTAPGDPDESGAPDDDALPAHVTPPTRPEQIGRVLRCPAGKVDRHQTMTDLGVGSMTGLELQRRIRAALGVAPDLPTILRAENTHVLALRLVDLLGATTAGALSA